MSNNETQGIDWEMLDKRKFIPLCAASSLSLKLFTYPMHVIKIRLQLQKQDRMYSGVWDAAVKIYRFEGIKGLYKGFWVNSLKFISGIVYATVNEGSRYVMTKYNVPAFEKSFICGGLASIASQTVVVPLDVVSQHLATGGMLNRVGKHDGLASEFAGFKFKTVIDVVHAIYQTDGPKGFFRGYMISITTSVPHSAVWWSLYYTYQDMLVGLLPENIPTTTVQFLSGSLSGATTAVMTNLLETVRTRIQVLRTKTIRETVNRLWQEEGVYMFFKGLRAKLIQSVMFSSFIILGYETIKKLAVKEEYKDAVRW